MDMGGPRENAAIIGDWVPPSPSPSPRTFFSTILVDSSSPNQPLESSKKSKDDEHLLESKSVISGYEDEKDGRMSLRDIFSAATAFSDQKFSSRIGLVERIAARAGFNAPRLNTESMRCSDISMNPEVRSPYLAIPPGLSPTTLLESPVLLTNSMVQPSPTTGKFLLVANDNSKSTALTTENPRKSEDGLLVNVNATFSFKPVVDFDSSFHGGIENKLVAAANAQDSFPIAESSVRADDAFQSTEQSRTHAENANSVHFQAVFSRASPDMDKGDSAVAPDLRASTMFDGGAEHSLPVDEIQDGEGDLRGAGDSISGGGGGGSSSGISGTAPSDDGYNWRKYGQKQVKGSEFPRSYYKCTHPNCPVKKKVERSQEGLITEIIYKGAHNHPKPPPNRRSVIGSSSHPVDQLTDAPEQGGTQAGVDVDPVWVSMQRVGGGAVSDQRNDNLEVTSSASGGPDCYNQSALLQSQNGAHIESSDAVDVSCTFSNDDDDDDDQGTHGSVSIVCDGEGDELESKRRKIEAYATELGGATRAIREPRVVVQTTSEVDILDDGYRWRKYGQKVVKGNPNPRSYYKCTHAGCNVRKHVERASHDLKSVITTYEGKHNHDVPAARNSSHVNSGGSTNNSIAQTSAVHRPEPSQVHNSTASFEAPVSSLGAFGIPAGPQLGLSAFPFGLSQARLTNVAMSGSRFVPNHAKLPVLPAPPYLVQQHPVNQMGHTVPGSEPKVESVTETVLNLPNGSLVYHQIMGSLPLGH
ncbi:WRKY transcription factor [Ancistrocladus abbreviatus]